MIKSLNKNLPKSRKPLNGPLRVQDSLRARRGRLPDRTHLVGAAALHLLVQVGQAEKFGLGRYNSISGRKSPLFDASRQIYQENFAQGLQSVLPQEAPWARDPRHLVLTVVRISA